MAGLGDGRRKSRKGGALVERSQGRSSIFQSRVFVRRAVDPTLESRATWESRAVWRAGCRSRFGEAVEAAGAVGEGVVEGAGGGDEGAEVRPAGAGFRSLQAVAGGIGIPCQAHGGAGGGGGKVEVREGGGQGGVGFDPGFGGWFAEADVGGVAGIGDNRGSSNSDTNQFPLPIKNRPP